MKEPQTIVIANDKTTLLFVSCKIETLQLKGWRCWKKGGRKNFTFPSNSKPCFRYQSKEDAPSYQYCINAFQAIKSTDKSITKQKKQRRCPLIAHRNVWDRLEIEILIVADVDQRWFAESFKCNHSSTCTQDDNYDLNNRTHPSSINQVKYFYLFSSTFPTRLLLQLQWLCGEMRDF